MTVRMFLALVALMLAALAVLVALPDAPSEPCWDALTLADLDGECP